MALWTVSDTFCRSCSQRTMSTEAKEALIIAKNTRTEKPKTIKKEAKCCCSWPSQSFVDKLVNSFNEKKYPYIGCLWTSSAWRSSPPCWRCRAGWRASSHCGSTPPECPPGSDQFLLTLLCFLWPEHWLWWRILHDFSHLHIPRCFSLWEVSRRTPSQPLPP